MTQRTDLIPPDLLDPRAEGLPPPPVTDQDYSSRLDGVVIPVWAGDVYLAKACCASIRQGMGDIPITVFVDGPATNTRDLQRLFGVQRIVFREVVDDETVRLCAGSPWTKMTLFWTSPYERFLCLDADLLVWGDLRYYAEFDKYDFIVTYHGSSKFETAEELRRGAFDLEAILKLTPGLDWRGRPATNTGVFFAKRGIFSREDLMALRRLNCWPCYESGVFHYLHWRALREENPRTRGHKLQLFPAEENLALEDRFLPRHSQRPSVIHWITKKPKLGRNFRACSDYRKLFLKMTGRSRWLGPRLFLEDVAVWIQRQQRSLRKRL